ncbi:structural maintenance of chromosomes protein 5-like isoform X2 [Polypterus senegalus]|uniref:structural maintenance of chromosomes protein 5-like isoform X2 n=1 Tax=Polypterus senegalus TaxID=55291 RepID=UPI001962B527|nr:structural maintenance of chromosomes protein 5-like isoform X2 [Polypterus senegalus]
MTENSTNLPQQLVGSVDCGVFMLMYALHLVLDAPFDFTACDLPLIRRWWCFILLENFAVERTKAFTKGALESVNETQSSEEEPLIKRDLHTAVKWLHQHRQLFRGAVSEPHFLEMEEEDQSRALQDIIDAVETEDLILAKEPFIFIFQFRDDMELFTQKCRDKMKLKVNCIFNESV